MKMKSTLQCRTLPRALFALVLAVSRVTAAPYDFLDNYRNKAPTAEQGPPASYHATRDRNWLPYEVCGVVGGYVFTVLIWAVLLLTVGRRMRRKALDPPKVLDVELEHKPVMDKTPVSPATSWLRKFRKNDGGTGSSPQSPVVQSPTSFDQKVIDADRERAQEEMERLYAAVMDHDRKKHSPNVSVHETDMPERRRPSAINVTRYSQDENNDKSPISPVQPLHHTAPQTAPLAQSRLRDLPPPPSSPRSILSKRTQPPQPLKSTRFNLKNLRLSGSSEKYPGAASDDEARTPLSPRFHPSRPSPATQTNSPVSPYIAEGEEGEEEENMDKVRPLPRPAPQRQRQPPTITLSTSTSTTPPSTSPSKTTLNNPLPLRSYHSASPSSPYDPPTIQTTVLNRRIDPLSHSLTTPKTGIPYTPYSPYMPFTPVTPVTPRLVTKRERKEREKVGRRRGGGARDEEVKSEREIFGGAY